MSQRFDHCDIAVSAPTTSTMRSLPSFLMSCLALGAVASCGGSSNQIDALPVTTIDAPSIPTIDAPSIPTIDASPGTPDASPIDAAANRPDAAAPDAMVPPDARTDDYGYAVVDGTRITFGSLLRGDGGANDAFVDGESGVGGIYSSATLYVYVPNDVTVGFHLCSESNLFNVGLSTGNDGDPMFSSIFSGGSCAFRVVKFSTVSGEQTTFTEISARVVENLDPSTFHDISDGEVQATLF